MATGSPDEAAAALQRAIDALRQHADVKTAGRDLISKYRELGTLLKSEGAGKVAQNGHGATENGGTHKGFGQDSVIAAAEALRRGDLILVSDDEDRENEGDLIMASQFATPETIAFMVRFTSGLICVSMPGERMDELELPPMVVNNQDPKGTAFTVSVDAKVGTTTGISAGDRAETLRQLADPTTKGEAFNRPGHIFPLRARPGGVVERQGHTEATVDLLKLAGLEPCGALCEVVSADGLTMARMPELLEFAKEHSLVFTTIADLVAYRKEHDQDGCIVPIKPSAEMAVTPLH